MAHDAHPVRAALAAALAAAAALIALSLLPQGAGLYDADCEPAPEHRARSGTQGMKTWSDDRLVAFPHKGEVHCVPQGWEAVGASSRAPGRAVFPAVQTAVMIRSGAFVKRTYSYENTRFPVEVIWPATTSRKDLKGYHQMIRAAFEHVGALYPAFPDRLATPHQVLITAGVGGDTYKKATRIYPEPGTEMSIVVRRPDRSRAEELLIHAVGHLYNRHRPYWLGGQEAALPLPFKDWQELVATWTETAFLSSHRGRLSRLRYLHNVHTAVREGDHLKIKGPPFDKEKEFRRIVQDVNVGEGARNITLQYNHYILSPLSMVATEGLLAEVAPEVTVARLLRETFSGEHESYHAALRGALGEEAYARVEAWWGGEATIPKALVMAGAERYEQGAALHPERPAWRPGP